jgi:pyruvate,water dikinase
MKNLAGHLRSLLGIRRRKEDRESFERLLGRFRAVLDSNNRSLEIMTEMGDILGGDYLFDIQYVKKAYAELSASLNDSLRTFDELTKNRYPRLHDATAKLDERIRHVIGEAGPGPASRELIVFYENITSDLAEAVGNKNANLAEVKNALKLAVPEAFAFTTHAFDSFMRRNGILGKIRAAGANHPLPSSLREELYELVLHGDIPPDLSRAVEKAVRKLKTRCGRDCFVSVRSSAGEEDGDYSFAGQFETVLNIPLEREAVEKAYKKVIASLFSLKASVYQERLGYTLGKINMAVGCLAMVDAAVSGVLYTTYSGPDGAGMVISASWGLGSAVVEGKTGADHYVFGKEDAYEILEERIGEKDSMVVRVDGGGTAMVETPSDLRGKTCLTPEQITAIAGLGAAIEKHFRRPQDVEWAIDGSGRVYILQTRPLRLPEMPGAVPVPAVPDAQIIFRNKGLVVQKGAASGRVFIVKNAADVDGISDGAVLVARHDSSDFVRVMPRISAIITDRGMLTSHMASLSREFRIPTVVNVDDATKMLVHGQEVTVLADENGVFIYRGRVRQILERAAAGSPMMEDLYEFRKKRYILRLITPLNLVDPLRDDFIPRACKTVHDLLRFIHEKSVARLVEAAGYGLKTGSTVKLVLSIPAGIQLIDIGGGLQSTAGLNSVGPDGILSMPFRALIAGMTHPGIWRSDAVSLTASDFMTSMLRAPDIAADSANHAGSNIAVISRDYMNVSLKFGYHFTIVDCYCSANARNNHLYFRFAGGATDITKRSRRLKVIAAVLDAYGFNLKTKGDLIVARLANIHQDEMERVLDHLGRLISYTRQLDAELHDDSAVERSIRDFLAETYGVPPSKNH